MATVYVTIGHAGHLSEHRAPVFTGELRSETITSSGTNAQGSLTAKQGQIAQVVCATAVYARSGAAASASAGIYCPAGIPTNLGMKAGDKINVIDA